MLLSTMIFYVPKTNTIYIAKNDFDNPGWKIRKDCLQTIKFLTDKQTTTEIECCPLFTIGAWDIFYIDDFYHLIKTIRDEPEKFGDKVKKRIDKVKAKFKCFSNATIRTDTDYDYADLLGKPDINKKDE